MPDNSNASEVDSGGSIHLGEPDLKGRRISPWAWVPSVNFLQGMQYILVTQMFIVVFYTMGIPNGTAIFWLGLLSLPWTIKPLWGPLVDRYWTKRNWTTTMQLLVGGALLAAAATILLPEEPPVAGLPPFFMITILVLFAVAFASATHDIACDGYYMLAQNERQQAFFVGIRSTAFRVGWIFTLGPLVFGADLVQKMTGPPPAYVQVQAVAPGSPPEKIAVPASDAVAAGEQAIIFDSPLVAVDGGGESQIGIRLAQDPGTDKTITVVLKPKKKVAEVTVDPMIVKFTSADWSESKPLKVTVNAKLKKSATAYFEVTAGNVALGWSVVLITAGALYFLLAAYHRFIMPYSASDSVETENRPPFYIPALAVAATILVPFLLGYTGYRLLMANQATIGPNLFGALAAATEGADKKLYDFLYKLCAILAPTTVGFVLFFVPGLKDLTRSFFRKMSDVSRIGFVDVFTTFFAKEKIGVVISFLLLYRLGEIPLSSLKSPFLLGARSTGGLDMSLSEFAFTNSVIYVIALILGGLLSGWLISTFGLRRIIWILVAFMHLPNLGYVYMAHAQPDNLVLINAIIAFESFGYGVGLSAFLMVMILSAQGPYKTAHYALCTGFMALGVMIPQMPSGYIQEVLGYENFFILVVCLVIPGCLLIPFLPIDAKFGRKQEA